MERRIKLSLAQLTNVPSRIIAHSTVTLSSLLAGLAGVLDQRIKE
jgi:branched-subunit amino acid ABC-type transport system permease component